MEKERIGIRQTYSIRVTENAYSNIEAVTDYIAYVKLQPINAKKIGRGIIDTIKKIQINPLGYSECENLPTKSKIYREAKYKSWLIIFRIIAEEVIILGVIYGSQKVSKFRKLRSVK